MKLAQLLPLAAAFAALSTSPTLAFAEVHELERVPIVLRPARPLVTEVARPAATIDAAKVKAPTLPKIAEAVSGAPF